ncbi:MAG: transcriptional regulator [Thermoprotei archaeon]|nr:MAG: transcriptional regulator [Thermoprotei archaeon]
MSIVIVNAAEVPVRPLGKEAIKKLELALILGTLFRADVIERIKSAEDRLTWLDSLVVAAGALAREKAGLPISRIAEELGRTEATIRRHLSAETEAGKLVKETYEKLVRGENIELPAILIGKPTPPPELEELRKKVSKLERKISELKDKVSRAKAKIEEALRELTS